MELMANAHKEEYDDQEIMKEAAEAGGTFDSAHTDLKKGDNKTTFEDPNFSAKCN